MRACQDSFLRVFTDTSTLPPRRSGQLGIWLLRGLQCLIVAGCLAASPAFAQTQVGADIDGEAGGDQAGYAVAMSSDGSMVVVGARLNDGNGSNAGQARVHAWDGAAWVQVGADIDGETAGDQAGFAVAMSSDGSTVVVGAPFDDGNGSNAGHARVFAWDGAAWAQVGADIDGEAAGDFAGYAVAMSSDGSTLVVGARFNDGNGADAGHARVYTWDGAAWVQVGADLDGEAAGDLAGHAVAMSSDGATVVVGALFNDGNGSEAGHARVYGWNGSAWVQVGTDLDGEAAEDFAGQAVAMSSDGATVVVGARLNDGNGAEAGHARVYGWDGVAWVQVGADLDGEAAQDQAGSAVAVSSDGATVVVGAPLNGGNGFFAGHARVFSWDGAAWVQVGVDLDGEAASDQSGYAVAMSSGGGTVVVGALANDGNGANAGHARVYAFDGDGDGVLDDQDFCPATTAGASVDTYGCVFEDYIGATGPQGPQGLQGPAGLAGPQGPQGQTGATGPAGADGIDGTNGTDGTNGVDGVDGATGAQGPQGIQGETGPAGANGVAGTNGTDGADGATGPAGTDGTNGLDGINGTNGTDGADGVGPAGSLLALPSGSPAPAGYTFFGTFDLQPAGANRGRPTQVQIDLYLRN